MDNAGCHPEDFKGKFSKTKVVSLPANTDLMLLPLDLGIIKKFKVYYRKLLLTFALAKIEECPNATEIVKSVTVLHALRWVAEGWKCVKSDTIQKCFVKAGILGVVTLFQVRSQMVRIPLLTLILRMLVKQTWKHL